MRRLRRRDAAVSNANGTRCAVLVYSPRLRARPAPPIRRSRPMIAPDADAPLIERVKQGDVKAFEMLVVKYQRRIERLIGRMVRDVDLVPDIAQETFIRAYRALPQFRGDSAFYTWLYRIAVNTAKKALMDLKRDPAGHRVGARQPRRGRRNSPRFDHELSDGETPDAVLASKQIAAAVNFAIEGLSEELRQAITLARDRRSQLRGNRRGHELPDRHGSLADLPGARGDRSTAAAVARHPRGRALVNAGEERRARWLFASVLTGE